MAAGSVSVCKLPGCFRPQYVEHGLIHEFCGKKHAESYRQIHGINGKNYSDIGQP